MLVPIPLALQEDAELHPRHPVVTGEEDGGEDEDEDDGEAAQREFDGRDGEHTVIVAGLSAVAGVAVTAHPAVQEHLHPVGEMLVNPAERHRAAVAFLENHQATSLGRTTKRKSVR